MFPGGHRLRAQLRLQHVRMPARNCSCAARSKSPGSGRGFASRQDRAARDRGRERLSNRTSEGDSGRTRKSRQLSLRCMTSPSSARRVGRPEDAMRLGRARRADDLSAETCRETPARVCGSGQVCPLVHHLRSERRDRRTGGCPFDHSPGGRHQSRPALLRKPCGHSARLSQRLRGGHRTCRDPALPGARLRASRPACPAGHQ